MVMSSSSFSSLSRGRSRSRSPTPRRSMKLSSGFIPPSLPLFLSILLSFSLLSLRPTIYRLWPTTEWKERERELNIRENGESEGNVIITPRIQDTLACLGVNRKPIRTRHPWAILCKTSKKPSWKQSSSYNASAVQYDFSSLLRAKEEREGRKGANDCRCGTHEFKAFQNDFFLSFLPSILPLLLLLFRPRPSLALAVSSMLVHWEFARIGGCRGKMVSSPGGVNLPFGIAVKLVVV